MRDPLWGSVGTWSEERPKAIDPAVLPELLAAHPPHRELTAFLAGVSQIAAQAYRNEDPVAEFARVLSVARYRGRHVLIEIAGWALAHASTLDGPSFRQHLAGAAETLDVDDPIAVALRQRLPLLAQAVEARERGQLSAEDVLLCARLLDPRSPELEDLPELPDPMIEALRALAARLADPAVGASELNEAVHRRLARWRDPEGA